MIIKILAKKHAREILELLNKKNMYFSEIQKTLKINSKILTNILNELIEAGLVEKWEVDTGQKLPKSYYGITPKGRSALILYKIEDIVDKLEKESLISTVSLEIAGENKITFDVNTNNAHASI
ncbi:winged helix-turn-helix transcriptional regulator [Methanocaldococcus sp. 28A]